MRSEPVVSGPSPAERARTALAHAPTLALEVDGCVEVVDVRAVSSDGGLLLLLPAAAEICERVAVRPVPGLLHGARVSPLPVADRQLDAVLVHGQVGLVDADDLAGALTVIGEAYPGRLAEVVLRPDASALLRIAVGQVWLDGVAVEPDAFHRAESDPLADGSDEVVTHLVQDHAPELVQLAHLLDPALLRAARMIAPVRVDRYGLTFRLVGPAGSTLTRLDFPAALRGPVELPAALRELQVRAAQVRCCPVAGEPPGPARLG